MCHSYHTKCTSRFVILAAVDWRLYSQAHSLTDKQQKLADKIRRQELKIHNLRTETDRIRVGATAATCTCQLNHAFESIPS